MCYASVKIMKDIFLHSFGGNEPLEGTQSTQFCVLGSGGGLKEGDGRCLFENCGF